MFKPAVLPEIRLLERSSAVSECRIPAHISVIVIQAFKLCGTNSNELFVFWKYTKKVPISAHWRS